MAHVASGPRCCELGLLSRVPNYSIGVYIGVILGLYWDNGKENGNYRDYRDSIESAFARWTG